MRGPTLGIVALAGLLLATPAWSASKKDYADCRGRGDPVIPGCTRIINDRKESVRNRANAYLLRGLAWQSRRDYDRAIADFDAVIRLNPNDGLTYGSRGRAWAAKGDYDRAIADYDVVIRLNPENAISYFRRGEFWAAKNDHDRAVADFNTVIRLNPDHVGAYIQRGRAWTATGDYDRAIASFDAVINPKDAVAHGYRAVAWAAKGDYERAIADYGVAIQIDPKVAEWLKSRGFAYFYAGQFGPAAADFLNANDLADDAYSMLWRFLARARNNQDGAAELSANAARLKTKNWPYPVIDFYLGRRSLDEMQAAASTSNTKCEAEFYTGAWHVLRGNKDGAKAALQSAVDTCPNPSAEYSGAVAEQNRLGM